ncbi:MAG: 16S rRNA processing protein RimM [Flexistipes sinusarabici]|uniref:Ribosome maturation factor RimM n=1 Tax=Flexistipes sinusarabici TaxID=2352 RepID=A0A5D0MQZ3_FLESI|nr:ribosome maturation factor RimM [Flexistipes sinusarabici]TYB34183.1 MAG: 16S rRNA processing protein RimM [Flexistipes sinusarabici]
MKFFRIGRVAGHHGLDGEIKVRPITDNIDLYNSLSHIMLSADGEVKKSYKIESFFLQNKFFIITLEGLNDIEEAKALKGMEVVVPETFLPGAQSDEIYWYKIKGSSVFDENGRDIGVLYDYIESGGTDVFEIKGHDGILYLISNNPDHIKKIDEKRKSIHINSDGLVSEEV